MLCYNISRRFIFCEGKRNMSVFEKIKSFFNRLTNKSTTPALPAANTDPQREAFLKKNRLVTVAPPNDPTLEACIDEFIKQYAIHEPFKKSQMHSAYNVAYDSFVSMFSEEEPEEDELDHKKNSDNQLDLIKHVHEKNFHSSYQFSDKGAAFVRFLDADFPFEKGKDNNIEKLYINCPRKDISKLTKIVFDTLHSMQEAETLSRFEIKCVSEQYAEFEQLTDYYGPSATELYQRNDKIVIYAENHDDCIKIADAINRLQSQYPKLFIEIKPVPLLPKANGFVSVAPDVDYKVVDTPVGKIHAKTYHDLLSKIMVDSIVAGFDSYHGIGPYTKNTPVMDKMHQYVDEYVSGLEYLPKEVLNQMIQECKKSFIDICTKNQIDTLYTPQNKQVEIEKKENDR